MLSNTKYGITIMVKICSKYIVSLIIKQNLEEKRGKYWCSDHFCFYYARRIFDNFFHNFTYFLGRVYIFCSFCSILSYSCTIAFKYNTVGCTTYFSNKSVSIEPRSEKTGLQGFRPGLTQTGLYSHTSWLEA